MKSKCGTIAVIGSASHIGSNLKELAEAVGKTIVDSNCVLINGGMSGVMHYSAKGARGSPNYSFGCIVGILPSYDKNDANEYIDIVIPTGLGVARNTIVVAAAETVVVLDGGAGTLSELAMAWQMGKFIVCVGDNGWHKRIDSLLLDERKRRSIKIVENIEELKGVIQRKPDIISFAGIQKSSHKREE